jgi:Zn-dependent peptidase ImmA (M78 family)
MKLFDMDDKPSIVCRAKDRKEPMELQADIFAGYFLMPAEMIRKSWHEKYGKNEPYVAEKEIGRLSTKLGLGEDDNTPTVEIAREIAKDFKVSGQAMQIRLIGMGLIQVRDQGPSIFDGGADDTN